MNQFVVVLMNKAPLFLSSQIRSDSGNVLLRKVSLVRIHNSLIDLFIDRTAIGNSSDGFEDGVFEVLKCMHCKQLNDERTISFNQGWKQSSYVFNEKLGIWIDENIDVEKDNLFIPRSDSQ